MGVIKLPRRNQYFRHKKKMFRTVFNDYMPRDKFNLIWRYLHFSNNEDAPQNPRDKLFKLRWLIDYLNQKFQTIYTPYGDFTVDESMVKYKGRLSFKQYIHNKPTKWGIKLWSLCDAVNGYLSKFQVYTGRDGRQVEHGLSHRVVVDLVGQLEDRYPTIYMDNFYTSVDLLRDLIARGIYACGTVRQNRKGLPAEIMPKNRNYGKHDFHVTQNGDISFSVWQDTKPVLTLSTRHNPDDLGEVKHRSGQPEQRQILVPKMVQDYQEYIKGVDLCDQMCTYYIMDLRSRKWWRRLVTYLLQVSVYNSYIFAWDANPEMMESKYQDFQMFLEDVAEGLVGDYRAKREAPGANQVRPIQDHQIEILYETRKRCTACPGVGVRKSATRYRCRECHMAVCLKCHARHINMAHH